MARDFPGNRCATGGLGFPADDHSAIFIDPVPPLQCVTTNTVRSEVAIAFPGIFDQAAVSLRALDAERTFLEKVTLLHEESFRPPDKPRAQKLARHYYGAARMIQKGVGERASASKDLFDRVVDHRRIYFRQTRVEYDTMAPGSLRIVPDESRMKAWEKDYEAMQEEMFYGTPPT